MDIGEVLSFADGFSHAVLAADKDLIASYLSEDAEVNLDGELDTFPPLEMAKVLFVTPFGDQLLNPMAAREFISVINFWGKREEILLRAVWVQDPHQLLVRNLQVIERKVKAA